MPRHRQHRDVSTQQVRYAVLVRRGGPARRTKINSSDPPLAAVCTAYATPPFLPFFHPSLELASFRPGGGVHLNRRIDFPLIRFGMLLHLVVM